MGSSLGSREPRRSGTSPPTGPGSGGGRCARRLFPKLLRTRPAPYEPSKPSYWFREVGGHWPPRPYSPDRKLHGELVAKRQACSRQAPPTQQTPGVPRRAPGRTLRRNWAGSGKRMVTEVGTGTSVSTAPPGATRQDKSTSPGRHPRSAVLSPRSGTRLTPARRLAQSWNLNARALSSKINGCPVPKGGSGPRPSGSPGRRTLGAPRPNRLQELRGIQKGLAARIRLGCGAREKPDRDFWGSRLNTRPTPRGRQKEPPDAAAAQTLRQCATPTGQPWAGAEKQFAAICSDEPQGTARSRVRCHLPGARARAGRSSLLYPFCWGGILSVSIGRPQ